MCYIGDTCPVQSTATTLSMPRKQVRIWTDPDLIEAWNLKHGQYASLSWLLETAIKSTLVITQTQPTLGDSVKMGIEQKLLELRSERTEPDATT